MSRRYFGFTVRVRVDGGRGDLEAREAAEEALRYNLLRDGHWLSVGTRGTVTVTSIRRESKSDV